MGMKSDVKPVVVAAGTTSQVLFTGRTRLRGYMIQSTGSSGSCEINGLANTTTVSSTTTTGVYIPISVGAGQTETLNIPEDGVLYADSVSSDVVDGIGVTAKSTTITVTLFIDK